MNRLVLLLIICLAFPSFGHAQRKRALMIGISNYHSHGYMVWNDIHGAEDVALLTPELEKKGFNAYTLLNEQATYHGILNALNRFIANTKKGDIVYIHFSCHGQPVEDGLLGDEKDEKDGWDEALIPIDAGKEYDAQGYKGERHVTDDMLNVYFSRLRKKIGATGMLYVAMDACHAGTLSRKGLETVRGTNEGLAKNGIKYNPPKDNVCHYHLKNTKGLSPVLFLEACQSNERNTEIRIRGKEWGALSYNIWNALQGMSHLGNNVSEFRNRLEASTKNKKQWPRTQSLVFESSY